MDIPDFTSEPERQAWFIRNAEYFNIVRRANRRYYSAKVASLPKAEAMAKSIVENYPGINLMIYAVHGVSDCWVMNIMGKGLSANAKAKTTNTSKRRDTSV